MDISKYQKLAQVELAVSDTDIFIHFLYGDLLQEFLAHFSGRLLVPEQVLDELYRFRKFGAHIARAHLLGTYIREAKLVADGEPMKLYYAFRTLQSKGEGESACLALCKTLKLPLLSNNLRDIAHTCQLHGIDHYTSLDVLLCLHHVFGVSKAQLFTFIEKNLVAQQKLGLTSVEEFDTVFGPF